jgi:carbonic anhydrase
MIETLIKGASRFRRGYHSKHRERFARLVEDGQNPHTLFITCADSRVLPHAMTHASPGDIFVLRNVGNMVPACTAEFNCSATGAAIEYATSVLGVHEIVVCGHSHCGACAALYHDEEDDTDLSLTRRWLEQGRGVRDLILQEASSGTNKVTPLFGSREDTEQVLRATEKAMVVQHLRNLMTYPAVARRVAEKTLRLHGWHYTIETGRIERYDAERLCFVPLDARHGDLALRRA